MNFKGEDVERELRAYGRALHAKMQDLIELNDDLTTLLSKFLQPSGWTWENPNAESEYDFEWLGREYTQLCQRRAARPPAKTVTIEVDMPDALFLAIAQDAHLHGLTFNSMVGVLLRRAIARLDTEDAKEDGAET